jgi:hypothetical protein
MIHLIPDIKPLDQGHFANHCNYYYSEKFFNDLALNCNYTILENTIMDNLRCVALVKNSNDFWQDKDSFLKNINIIPMEVTR